MKRIHFTLFLSFLLGLGLLFGCDRQASSSASPTALKEKLTAIDKACFYLVVAADVRIDEEDISEEDTAKKAKLRNLQEQAQAEERQAERRLDRLVFEYDTLCKIARTLKDEDPIPVSRASVIGSLKTDNHSEQQNIEAKLYQWRDNLEQRYGVARIDALGRVYAAQMMLPESSGWQSKRVEVRRLLNPKTMALVDRLVDKIEDRLWLAAKHDPVIRREMNKNWKHVRLSILSRNRELVSGWVMLLQTESSESNQKDLKQLKKMAEAGDTEAQCLLGMQYEGRPGWLIPMDMARDRKSYTAAVWLQKAADKGNAEALARLSRAYYNGDGVEKDESKAKRCASMAAEQGNLLALALLMSSADSDYERDNCMRQMLQTDDAWLVPALFPRQYEKYNRSGLEK